METIEAIKGIVIIIGFIAVAAVSIPWVFCAVNIYWSWCDGIIGRR